jgi:hypothetical protein
MPGPRSQTTEDALLDAGAVAPIGTTLGERRDRLVARSYAHPALEGRAVVRLTPETLGRAEDLTLGFLGFAEPGSEASAEVGVVRQQALGFPAWALVHDPANGHHALDLIKDIERYARMAASKPGRAKDGFDGLARRLADAVPHFLPTYFEQAARAFLAVRNVAYATSYFTRAREAEQTHGLAIDEDAQAASFLEFALAGALSVKSLTAYAKELAARRPPQEAYERFRRICVERVAGGLPPHTGMPKDLRKLAKPAGRDTVDEAVDLARELLPLAALGKASTGFWTAYRPELERAARADARVRGLLLGMLPDVAASSEPAEHGVWLEILDECGATAGLTEPVSQLDPAALPAEGADRWLARYAKTTRRGWSQREGATREKPGRDLLRLVERMAGRLREAGEPLALSGWANGDVDLIDLCLALGLPVADPDPKQFSLNVSDWLKARSPRELTTIAADARFRPYLLDSVGKTGMSGGTLATHGARIARSAGLRAVVAEWLDRLAAQTAEAGLADLDELTEVWLRNAGPELLAVNVPAVRSVTGLDVADRLGHALRSGIFDEYGWPLLEDVCAEFSGAQPGAVPREAVKRSAAGHGSAYRSHNSDALRPQPVSQWPYLVVREGENVVVLGAEQELLGYRKAPAFTKPGHVLYRVVDDRLLIGTRSYAFTGFYADDPLRTIDVGPAYMAYYQEESLPLPGGGRTFGGTPLLSGHADWSTEGPVATDGTDFWTLVGPQYWGARAAAWQEFDPRTGKLGRKSMPGFFEQNAPAESFLEAGACWLIPAGSDRPDNPLGQAGGLVGSRLRILKDGTRVCTGVDGREQRLPQVPYSWGTEDVRALLDVPGAPGRHLAVVFDQRHAAYGTPISLVADGTRRTGVVGTGSQALEYARGTWCVPPLSYWSYLTVRDAAGSAALRALAPALATALLETGGMLDQEAAVEVVAALLPQVTDARLRAGVAGYVTLAGDCVKQLRKLGLKLAVAVDEPGAAQAAAAEFGEPEQPKLKWDADFQRVRAGVATYTTQYGPIHPELLIPVVVRAFTGVPTEQDAEHLATLHPRLWHELIESAAILPALAVRAVSPAYSAQQRNDLLDLLSLLAETELLAPGSALRRLQIVAADGKRAPQIGHAVATDHGRVLIMDAVAGPRNGTAVRDAWEWSRDGVFTAIPDWNITHERRGLSWPCAEPFHGFAEMARSRGAVQVQPEPAGRLAAQTGLSELESALLLAGLPNTAYAQYERIPASFAATLGAKSNAVTAAGARFQKLPAGRTVAEFVSLLLPEKAEELWESGPDTDRVAELWVARHGRLEPLPDRLRESAERECSPRIVQALLNPDVASSVEAPAPDHRTSGDLALAVSGVLWLAYTLEVGDPLRARLPEAVARLRREVTDPDYFLVVGIVRGTEDFAAQHGYTLKTVDGLQHAGPFAMSPGNSWVHARLYPGRLGGAGDQALQIAAALTGAYQSQDVNSLISLLDGTLEHLAEAAAAAVSDTATEPYPAQDPSRSAPELVSEVAAAHGMSEDAATLYLMLLALPDPTDRRQAGWLGWKPARLKAARAELAGTDLVVSGTRTRAGRGLFLPGPWHPMTSPRPPIEKWKGEALGVTPNGGLMYARMLPRVPVPELFRAAWQRVRAGDGPRYEELDGRRGR